MTKVGAIGTYGLAVAKDPYILPNDLFIPETRPAVCFAFLDKVSKAAANRRLKQELTSDRVIIIGNDRGVRLCVLASDLVDPSDLAAESIPTELSVMSVEAADFVSLSPVTAILEFVLYRVRARSMLLLIHQAVVSSFESTREELLWASIDPTG